jgi:hypothetical protein
MLIKTMQELTKHTKENLERTLQERKTSAEQIKEEKKEGSFNILA